MLNERLSSLEKERERLLALSESSRAEISSHTAEKLRLEKLVSKFASDTGSAEEELRETESRLNALESHIADKENELEEHKQSMMNRLNRLSDARSKLSRLDEMKKGFASRLEAIAEEKAAAEAEGEKLALEESGCKALDDELASELEGLRAEQNEAAAEINRINMSIIEAGQREQKLVNELESKKSRLKVLTEMKRAHEGYYTTVRDLLRDAERDTSLSALIEGVVAELITVPEEYETAIEMALGSALQNIIVPTPRVHSSSCPSSQ